MTRQLAKIIADSRSPHGVRLTTMEIVLPRIVLAELNTHRVVSKNSASSRAIPVEKMLGYVREDPYVPERWGQNGKGMQDHGELDEDKQAACVDTWLGTRDKVMEGVEELLALGVHKQTTNRWLEPAMWHTVIVTATEWGNFFNLRCHPMAHPAIRRTAEAMRDAMEASTPRRLQFGEWHLPFVDERDEGLPTATKIKLSTARCARVSYLTHDGVRDPSKDVELHDRLLSSGHMSPLEHAARPAHVHDVKALYAPMQGVSVDTKLVKPNEHFFGNFRGWVQYRKTINGEADILAHRDEVGA